MVCHSKIYHSFSFITLNDFHHADSDESDDDVDDEPNEEPLPLVFQAGFFEVIDRTNNSIKANCLVCDELGRSHFVHGKEKDPSNFLLHLQVNENKDKVFFQNIFNLSCDDYLSEDARKSIQKIFKV